MEIAQRNHSTKIINPQQIADQQQARLYYEKQLGNNEFGIKCTKLQKHTYFNQKYEYITFKIRKFTDETYSMLMYAYTSKTPHSWKIKKQKEQVPEFLTTNFIEDKVVQDIECLPPLDAGNITYGIFGKKTANHSMYPLIT